MKADINVKVLEPFLVAAESQPKDKIVPVSAADARILVSSGKAEFATEADRDKAYTGGELGEPGVRTRVESNGRTEVEHVNEERVPVVHVEKTERPGDYAKRKRAGGDVPPEPKGKEKK